MIIAKICIAGSNGGCKQSEVVITYGVIMPVMPKEYHTVFAVFSYFCISILKRRPQKAAGARAAPRGLIISTVHCQTEAGAPCAQWPWRHASGVTVESQAAGLLKHSVPAVAPCQRVNDGMMMAAF